MENKPFVLKNYTKELPYSYTSGAYATIELLKAKQECLRAVCIHSNFVDKENLAAQCQALHIPVWYGDKYFTRINQKENAYVMGVFDKYRQALSPDRAHILLVNPSDMGNLGTIIRTAAGLGFLDIGIILPACDHFHPKTIRASMGAIFHVCVQAFDSFEAYKSIFETHCLYPFMLDGQTNLHALSSTPTIDKPFTLIFGNEATGLDPSFLRYGTSVRIPQTECVDSLNLAVAVSISAFIFARHLKL